MRQREIRTQHTNGCHWIKNLAGLDPEKLHAARHRAARGQSLNTQRPRLHKTVAGGGAKVSEDVDPHWQGGILTFMMAVRNGGWENVGACV